MQPSKGHAQGGFLAGGPSLDYEIDSPGGLGHMPSPEEESSSFGERCSYVEVAQMPPHLGCRGGRKWNAGMQSSLMRGYGRGRVSQG